MAKTKGEIDAEILKLENMMLKVRATTAFGDNNHNAIEAQIDTLECDFDEIDVFEIQGEEDEHGDFPDTEWSRHEADAALRAIGWRDGDDPSPSEFWKDLLIN